MTRHYSPALAKDVDPNGEFLRATRETQYGPGWDVGDELALIEQALKFDPDPEYRRQLRRLYLDLTDKKDAAA